MNWLSLTLLAQSDRFSDLGGRFQESGSDLTWNHLLLGGVIVAAVLGVWAIALYLGLLDRHGRRSHRRLFRELCRLHNLDWPSRRLLQRLALVHNISSPAQLFLQPEKFDSQQLIPALVPFAGQIEELRGRLFDDAD